MNTERWLKARIRSGNKGTITGEENCACKEMGVKQNQTCREVCTVGIGDDHSLTEPISFEGGADELRKFFRSGPGVSQTWLCEPSERRRHAIFQKFGP